MTSPEFSSLSEKKFQTAPFPNSHRGEPISELVKGLGISLVLGNSANKLRQSVSSGFAATLAVPYRHVDLSNSTIDELARDQYEMGLRREHGAEWKLDDIRKYQDLTTWSKLFRLTKLPDKDLEILGLTNENVWTAVVLLADTINFVDGMPMEKPKDDGDAVRQISRLVSGKPYLVTNFQLAARATWQVGAGSSMHITPVRFDPMISEHERSELEQYWINMYRSGKYPRTPGAVSQTNPGIIDYLQIGLWKDPDKHLVTHRTNEETVFDEVNWIQFDHLPASVRDEIGTTISGCSPRGYAAAVADMVIDVNLNNAQAWSHAKKVDAVSRLMGVKNQRLPSF